MTARKKLIEVSIPLEAINAASAREKSIRHGHPSTLHLWWARRPLAACRAVLFAQLVDDPSSWPDRFPTPDAVEAERKRLHDVIAAMVPWEASADETVLGRARWHIARSVAWGLGEEPPPEDDRAAVLAYLQTKAPPVYDPFSGGGSIPLEAQRLGLRAYGSDLNPVAVLIGKALVEIPPRFAGRPPVNPGARARLAAGAAWNGRGAEGLAEDVRYYGRWMRDEAERRIGHLYPRATLPDGREATVIAWLWARTVRSPDPAARGAMVPLVSSFMLSTKDNRKSWVEPVLDAEEPDGYRFEVRTGPLPAEDEARLKKGTKSAKAQAFVCLLSGSPVERPYIQQEGKAGRLGVRLMAVVAEGDRQRVYRAPTAAMEEAALRAADEPRVAEARAGFLSGATPTRAMITGGVCSAYGLSSWGHLFTDRQIVALTTFSDLVATARERVAEDGSGDGEYADAVATYLGLGVSRLTNRSSTLNFWDTGAGNIQQVFGRQALAMTWDFCEGNPFSDSSGNFMGQIDYMRTVVQAAPAANTRGMVWQGDATDSSVGSSTVIIATDPPYYDNISYAELSDYFYPWLRRTLAGVQSELCRRLLTPKTEELIAAPFRHSGKRDRAEQFFLEGMAKAMSEMRRTSVDNSPLTLFYAFKQSESGQDGISSTGWASFLQAGIDAGLIFDGTWPVRTELIGNLKKTINALASSVVLVCRKRPEGAGVSTRAEFLRALKREMPDALAKIREAGIRAVDFQQAAIGPGMGVFSRYARVLEPDDTPMPVRTALALINNLIEELEDDPAQYDAPTQVAITWFREYGWGEQPSGTLIMLANAKGTSVDALKRTGVFDTALGKARLVRRAELTADWRSESDRAFAVWEGAQHLARTLVAEDGGIDAAARLLAGMTAQAGEVIALVFRLFQIAERDRKDAAEALVWNRLSTEWPTIESRALDLAAATAPAAPAQGVLL
ncbi:DUF1156 domain-containing protein [Azospirillum sp. RWY-5-1]|uniref:DUF1156 domain-containing protein n=1 Tax=Azospirillum oleiclasticum TaxID=2735135 RepID=A0ABX2TBU2_9PROT|nr:DUF1156 domain-containing protein [Azospirillum oleiclasticum]NYZ16884.1 DUF1156 domain-containing protein [Azospirillum oleiclasticum]NYZ21821.1 DUF1156 domain-containing protein [Azospirillum oleiclasticum]